MVIYMDSDYSGSMFEGLPEDIDSKMLYENHNAPALFIILKLCV